MDDGAKGILAECVHTAFRKGGSSLQANVAWHAIREVRDWPEVVEWMAWALEESGYQLIKKPTTGSTVSNEDLSTINSTKVNDEI